MEKSIYNANKKREGEMGWVDGVRAVPVSMRVEGLAEGTLLAEMGYGHNKKTVQIMQM